jgi:hypothetical protein
MVKITEDGNMRIRTFDRNSEQILMDKELSIGKFIQSDDDEDPVD